MFCSEILIGKCISHEEFTGHGGTFSYLSVISLQVIQHFSQKKKKKKCFTKQTGNKWIFTLIALFLVLFLWLIKVCHLLLCINFKSVTSVMLEHAVLHMWPFLTSVIPDFNLLSHWSLSSCHFKSRISKHSGMWLFLKWHLRVERHLWE